MINFNGANKGISILGIVLLGVVVILVISYFNIDIKTVVEDEEVKGNFSYITAVSQVIWNDYLKRPASYIWNEVIVSIIWKGFLSGSIERLRHWQPANDVYVAPPEYF